MGAYINPKDMTKERWLDEFAEKRLPSPNFEATPDGYLPVVLVDNGIFTAAGIAYSPDELAVFNTPDGREKEWFIAKIDDLHTVSPELGSYLK